MSRVSRMGPPAFQQHTPQPQGKSILAPVKLGAKQVVLSGGQLQQLQPRPPPVARPIFPLQQPEPFVDDGEEDVEEEVVQAQEEDEKHVDDLVEAIAPLKVSSQQQLKVTPFIPPPILAQHELQPGSEAPPAEEKKKRVKKPKDPNAPPKELSAWNLFVREQKDHPDVKAAGAKEKMKVLSELYRAAGLAKGPKKERKPKAQPEESSILIPPVGA